jgi:putative hydrolase of the HAD superfamily
MIKNLIFDCGGVVFGVDYNKSLQAFKQLSSKPELFENIKVIDFKHIASDFETGKQTINEFFEYIRDSYYLKATNDQIIQAWNTMLLNFIPESINLIEKLNKHFKTALFTNTNELHFLEFAPICRKLLDTFNYCYYSHKIGLKKPYLDSFEYVLKNSNFKAEETIFIDDSIENVEAAAKLGIIPLHYNQDWDLNKLEIYLMSLTNEG